MGSRRRSSFSEPNPGSTTSIGTSNNYGGSLEFQTSFSSASKSQCSDVVSEAVEEENPMAQMWRTPSLKEFSFKDLKIATNNFSPDCLLGEGGFGRVYKGWVDEETLAPSSKRGIGMAVAIKIWNSDKNYNAKLSGFGLAMLGPPNEESPISTVILGTYGYVAPEYIGTGNIYLKSDVYSYGVVLLELLMGLRAIDQNRPTGKHHLVEWLKPKLFQSKNMKTIMDVRMDGQYSFEAAVRAAQLSLRCLDSDPQSRPSIKEVMEELKEIEALKG